MNIICLIIIAVANGIVWFVVGYRYGKESGEYSDIDHYETELIEDKNGKWFLRYTPYLQTAFNKDKKRVPDTITDLNLK